MIPSSIYFVFFYSLKLLQFLCGCILQFFSHYIFCNSFSHHIFVGVTIILLLISGKVCCYTFVLGDAVDAHCIIEELLFHTAGQHTQKYYCWFLKDVLFERSI